jgi:hypothetical protein
MKDQMEMKVLTNSFTFSHSPVLLMGAIIAFALICSFYITGFGFIGILVTLSAIGYLAWENGHVSGVNRAVESTLEFLVEEGYLEKEIIDEEIQVCRVDELIYTEECECGERLIVNESVTKGHIENGKDYEKE